MDGSGRVVLRNRAHLRKIAHTTVDNRQHDTDMDEPSSTAKSFTETDTAADSSAEADTADQPLLVPGHIQDGTAVDSSGG